MTDLDGSAGRCIEVDPLWGLCTEPAGHEPAAPHRAGNVEWAPFPALAAAPPAAESGALAS